MLIKQINFLRKKTAIEVQKLVLLTALFFVGNLTVVQAAEPALNLKCGIYFGSSSANQIFNQVSYKKSAAENEAPDKKETRLLVEPYLVKYQARDKDEALVMSVSLLEKYPTAAAETSAELKVLTELKVLLKAGANIEALDFSGKTALSWAVLHENNTVVEFLLKAKANPNSKNRDGSFALMEAGLNQNFETMDLLLQYGANINLEYFPTHQTVLEWLLSLPEQSLSATEKIRSTQYLLGQNALGTSAKVEQISNSSKAFTVLEKNDSVEVIYLLMKAGAKIDFQQVVRARGMLERIVASRELSVEVKERAVSFLLQQGENPNYGKHHLPLILAIRSVQVSIVEILLKGNANVNGRHYSYLPEERMSPFTFAMIPFMGWVEVAPVEIQKMISLLIKYGANVNARDGFGSFPLHHAIRMGDLEIVRMLVEAGADIQREDSQAQTPLYIALLYKDRQIVEYLKSKGAKKGSVFRRWNQRYH